MNQPTGVFNPIKETEEPKPDPRPWTRDAPPEPATESRGVRLDGDSFSIAFGSLDEDDGTEEIAERLAKLLCDVNAKFRAELRECGIKVLSPTIAYVTEPGEMALRSKTAVLVVATGATQDEASAFRVIGHALHALPIKEILKKHNAKLHVRG